jgi:uncharacterized protein (TIGR02421 family)
MSPQPNITNINDEWLADLEHQLRADEQLRYDLAGGEIHIDRQLPFVCLYRQPAGDTDPDPGTGSLLMGQAAYLKATAEPAQWHEMEKLLRTIIRIQSELFGGFLLLELWAGQAVAEEAQPATADFLIHAPSQHAPGKLLEAFENALQEITLRGRQPRVRIGFDDTAAPPGLPPLIDADFAASHHCLTLGLEIAPVYRGEGGLHPYALRVLQRGLTHALKQLFYHFSHDHTRFRPSHYHQLGPRSLTNAVWESDKQLAAISEQFDLLLHVTPVNAAQAWRYFQVGGYRQTPEFHYRPRGVDPALLKRELYQVPLEKIDDPTLADLFDAKRDELDRQLTLLNDRETPSFLHGSQQLFGHIDADLLATAQRLAALPAEPKTKAGEKTAEKTDEDSADKSELLDAAALAREAENELDYYRQFDSSLSATVAVRDDISGILVSHGNFLISSDARVSRQRLRASLDHEIGTHALTYHNGKKQPFQQLYAGMAGYEELQEGLAVLAEYLSGGLDLARLQLLAGRVLAVHSIVSGDSFTDTFARLHEEYGFHPFTAFNISMRVFRGGGYTKDMIYLRGLMEVIDYIGRDEDLQLLYCGKFALAHLPLMQELQWREVIRPLALHPRYLETEEARQRLTGLKAEPTIDHIIERLA